MAERAGVPAEVSTALWSLMGFATVGEGVTDGMLDPTEVDFHRTGLVSVFIRHRLDLVPLAGATERNVVQIHDPSLKPKSRPSDRRQTSSSPTNL